MIHKAYTFKQQHYLVLSPLVFFRLSDGELLPESAQWPCVQKALAATELLDMAMPKSCGEVLLAGHAYGELDAQGQPVTRHMSVRLSVGTVDKTLSIVGDRIWRRGLMPLQSVTQAQTFEKMPLNYAHSFGGEGYAENPSGKGYMNSRQRWLGKNLSANLPNINAAKNIPHRPLSESIVTGFGPVDIGCPRRAKKAGTYDRDWVTAHFPGYAPDLDWSLFNAAPEDQWIDGFWRGDEDFLLEGMSPTRKSLQGALPGVRMRVFIARARHPLTELPVVLDTLWFFPDFNVGVLLFRARIECRDSEAADISATLLAYENLCDRARPAQHYHSVFQLRNATDKKVAMAHAFNESPLSPLKTQEQLALEAQELAREQQRIQQQQADLQQELMQEHQLQPDFFSKSPQPAPLSLEFPCYAPEAIARGDIDLSAFIDAVDTQTKKVQALGEAKLAQLQAQLDQELSLARAALDAKQSERDQQTLAQQKKAAKKQLLGSGLAQRWRRHQAFRDSKLAEVDETLTQAARRYAQKLSTRREPWLNDITQEMRAIITSMHSHGRQLAGRDFAGFDLSGMDFSGANLEGAFFEACDLSGCNFAGANLRQAVFVGANLDDSDFADACLVGANLCDCRAANANFAGVDFSETCLSSARFVQCCFKHSIFVKAIAPSLSAIGCDFSHARVQESQWLGAQLRESNWYSAHISKSLLLEAELNLASFKQASIHRCALIQVKAMLCDFSGADLDTVQFATGSQLLGARFIAAQMRSSNFRSCCLKGADFSNASVLQCDFSGSDLNYSNFSQSGLDRCVLSGAQWAYANLHGLSMGSSIARKVFCRESDLADADFLKSDWQQAIWMTCSQEGIHNLNTTLLERY